MHFLCFKRILNVEGLLDRTPGEKREGGEGEHLQGDGMRGTAQWRNRGALSNSDEIPRIISERQKSKSISTNVEHHFKHQQRGTGKIVTRLSHTL